MARPDRLIAGNCYFLLQFHDDDLLLPAVSTLVFARIEEDSELGRRWLFHDLSMAPDDPQGTSDEASADSYTVFGEDELYQILDFPELLSALEEVAADHPLRQQAMGPPSSQLEELRRHIVLFRDNPKTVSLTITILFTDDGLSLARDEQVGLEICFYLSSRREVRQEVQIRAIFRDMHIRPTSDYLANRGRTRVLHFPVPNELDAVRGLCTRVFSEVESDGNPVAPSTPVASRRS